MSVTNSRFGRHGYYIGINGGAQGNMLILSVGGKGGIQFSDGVMTVDADALGPLLTELVQMARDLGVTAPPDMDKYDMTGAWFSDTPDWPRVERRDSK